MQSASAIPWSMSPRLNFACDAMLLGLSDRSSFTSTLTWPLASERSISMIGLRASGEPSSIAANASRTAGSSSYSMSIRSSASSAIDGVSARTATTGCPLNTTSSSAKRLYPLFDIRFSLNVGRSAAVMTRSTPSSASAFEASMPTMRACACGLRSSLQCSMPGS